MTIIRILMSIMLAIGFQCAASYAEDAPVTKVQSELENSASWQAIGLMVMNGNTMEVVSATDSKIQLVVLSGIAAPARGQPYYKEARAALKELVYGKKITVTPVKSGRNGFQIVKIQVADTDVAIEMVKNGWAWVHKFYSDNPELVALETAAREKKIGVWQDENPIAPWEFRKQQRAAREQQKQESTKDVIQPATATK